MIKLPFTIADLKDNFDRADIQRGQAYQQHGFVKNLSISSDGGQLRSIVQPEQKHPCNVEVKVSQDKDGLWIDGTCSCPKGFNCEHVTATLWEALAQAEHYQPKIQEDPVERWLEQLDSVLKNEPAPQTNEHIVYLLTQRSLTEHSLLQVEPCLAHQLKRGSFSKPKPLSSLSSLPPTILPIDKQILYWLKFVREQYEGSLPEFTYPLTGHNGVELLRQLIETGRCYWASTSNPALTLGKVRKAQLEWQMEPNGLQHLHCRIAGSEAHTMVPLTPPWYIDHIKQQCGPIETGIDPSVAAALMAAPPLKPDQIRQLYEELTKRLEPVSAPLPKTFAQERTEKINPVPCLRLLYPDVLLKASVYSNWRPFEIKLPLAELSFRYGQANVLWNDSDEIAHYADNNVLVHVPRQISFEMSCTRQLKKIGLKLLKDVKDLTISDSRYQYNWLIANHHDQQKILDFGMYELSKLREQGWEVQMDSDYPYRLIDESSTEWYSEVEDYPAHGWFNFELGVNLEGQKINLLPLLLQLIEKFPEHFTREGIASIPEKTPLLVRLPDGRYLPVPIERVRTILNILTELFDADSLTSANKLQLSRFRAGQMLDLETIIGKKHFRWLGGERLKELGEHLRRFTGIKQVDTPEGFQTTLRPYQQEGLNWLQFLREYDLAGILADDMGLGKTVQALAHILTEKRSGRMDKPSLVIAPTSLMFNWRMEANRFAPDLKVLTLHGAERRPHFAAMKDFDLILTTYPLLVRDKEALLAETYHLLILDEAQVIKNPKAKATQIVNRIEARHRLCMTGTPMENHLGELWSLFNFLLPGFLGDYKQFKRLFRTPIEEQQNQERREILAKRVAPFMLRRTKQKVLQELPDKTEMIRSVELDGVQRDLYESIRIAMHQKIVSAILDKGLAQSKIVILDALLKLRQICCDPRLLKLPAAQKMEAGSAKLELLMDLLPNLVEEGRRILLFSQFTEMLELIENECHHHHLPYVKLTGQTKDRESVVSHFQSGTVPLFLISLKAGGIGLNLTAADTVIHYDPWWNPAVEQQATDRTHRIGQEKAVFVYKLIVSGTVEEKILNLQSQKQQLFEGLFSDKTTTKVELNQRDLEELFKPL